MNKKFQKRLDNIEDFDNKNSISLIIFKNFARIIRKDKEIYNLNNEIIVMLKKKIYDYINIIN